MKTGVFLGLILFCGLAGCSRSGSDIESIEQVNWIQNSVTNIPIYNSGWSLLGGGGGGSSDGADYLYELKLAGKSLSEASLEMEHLIKEQLLKNGFTINGGGRGGNTFSIRASSQYVRGTIMVLFGKPTAEGIPVSVAIAQVARH
jgi:hypothetical protein